MKRKRSVASYRAASLKAARTRKKMKEARQDFIDYLHPETVTLTIRRPTIDRIPKVEWK